jgi:hypothetical protein
MDSLLGLNVVIQDMNLGLFRSLAECFDDFLKGFNHSGFSNFAVFGLMRHSGGCLWYCVVGEIVVDHVKKSRLLHNLYFLRLRQHTSKLTF